jgi:pimeloyl-ACP methyl ester carboxylesterase
VPYHAGTGEPLVLLHGFTDTWRAWVPVLPALSEHHEVYAWSLPGHFNGEPWDRSVPLTIPSLVDAVERQLDALGLNQAHLVGNSLGGWVSLELAARGRALSVVGVCPAGGWEPGGRDERKVVGFFIRSQWQLRHLARLVPFVARHPRLRKIAMRDVLTDGRKMPAEEALAMFEGARQCTIVDDVLDMVGGDIHQPDPALIECPVRILYGSKDRVLRWPSCYSRMRQTMTKADWVALEGVGHVPMWDSPDAVSTAILEHTKRGPH